LETKNLKRGWKNIRAVSPSRRWVPLEDTEIAKKMLTEGGGIKVARWKKGDQIENKEDERGREKS